MTGGDPNLSFLGRWQSEQRCKKNPWPRLSCSLSFPGSEREAPGFVCAGKFAPAGTKRVREQIAEATSIPILKRIHPRNADMDGYGAKPRLNFCTATIDWCQEIRNKRGCRSWASASHPNEEQIQRRSANLCGGCREIRSSTSRPAACEMTPGAQDSGPHRRLRNSSNW